MCLKNGKTWKVELQIKVWNWSEKKNHKWPYLLPGGQHEETTINKEESLFFFFFLYSKRSRKRARFKNVGGKGELEFKTFKFWNLNLNH